MSDGNPSQGLGEEEGPDLAARLSDMSTPNLIDLLLNLEGLREN
jgi:hypothetical protein